MDVLNILKHIMYNFCVYGSVRIDILTSIQRENDFFFEIMKKRYD